jgi:CDP-diacylglycerol---glycerol-3-phosphate 3-phosphatidyltransferase
VLKANLQIANLLSWSRIISTPVIMGLLMLNDWPPAYLIAAIIFALAEITDVLDGYFARRQKTVSNLGIFLDLTADKLFTAGVLVAMIEMNIISSWLVAIILGREFLITGMRTYAASAGVVIPAGKWGKRKTVMTGVSLTWLILWADAATRPDGLLKGLNDLMVGGDFQPFKWFFLLAWPLVYFMVFLTLYSGFLYMKDAAHLFSERPPAPPGPPQPVEPLPPGEESQPTKLIQPSS